MDPEIPQLGPGFEPADPAVRGTDHAVFIEKRTGRSSCTIIPAAPTLSVGIYSIARKFPPYSRGRDVGRAHEKWHICKCLVFHAENLLKVYTQKNSGYTKSRRKIRQQKIPKIDSKFLHIELLSREAWASKDTRFLTLSPIETMRAHMIIRDICKFLHRLIECLLGTKFI